MTETLREIQIRADVKLKIGDTFFAPAEGTVKEYRVVSIVRNIHGIEPFLIYSNANRVFAPAEVEITERVALRRMIDTTAGQIANMERELAKYKQWHTDAVVREVELKGGQA